MAWWVLAWVRRAAVPPQALPPAPSLRWAAARWIVGILLGAASFAAGGRPARRGAAFGASVGAIGWCASWWLRLVRAIRLCGGIFAGPFLSFLLAPALLLTAAAAAAVLWIENLRGYASRLLLAAVCVWASATGATRWALTRGWDLGPDTLAQAAGLPIEGGTAAVARLSPSGGSGLVLENQRMEAPGADLSPRSLAKLEGFLRRVGFRDVFAAEALSDLRRGWLAWWDCDRALAAMSLSAPGRFPPDYRGALDLIKVGPLNAGRFETLERLSAEASASSAGLENVTQSQRIFEGFAAAYARFGDEDNARRWLKRLDNLMMVSEKKFEVAPLESFRAGRVSGTALLDGKPAVGVMVGLFQIWRTTSTAPGVRLLSNSAFPDVRGRFAFGDLGPGEYELSLMGRPEDLRGAIAGFPGRFDIDADHPAVQLSPIRISRAAPPPPAVVAPTVGAEAPSEGAKPPVPGT